MRYVARQMALAAILSLGGSAVWAQVPPNELLNRTQALTQTAIQQTENEMRLAFAEAARLQQAGSVARANERLKQALARLDNPLLPPAKVTEWRQQIQDRLRSVSEGKKPVAFGEAPSEKKILLSSEAAKYKAVVQEGDEVRRKLDTITTLTRSGRNDLAKLEAEELRKKYPENPVSLALADTTLTTDNLAQIRQIYAQQQEGFRQAMVALDKASIPPKGDIEYDAKRWKEITELRKPKISAELQGILRALNTPVRISYKDAPFEEVIQSLSDLMKKPILLDKSALGEAMIESSTPTTLNTRGDVSARTALRAVLQGHGLTFVVKDNSIQVVTIAKASQMMTSKAYYLGDIVSGQGGGALAWGPIGDRLQTEENVRQVIKTIQNSVDPDSWKESQRGGQGTISFHWPSMSLIVRQTAEVHAMMQQSLSR